MTRLLQRLWDRLVPLRDDWAGYSRLDRADGLREPWPDNLAALMDAVQDDAAQEKKP